MWLNSQKSFTPVFELLPLAWERWSQKLVGGPEGWKTRKALLGLPRASSLSLGRRALMAEGWILEG